MGRRTDAALTRTKIAEAALDIFDEDGAAAVTVRNIATRLDVQSPSLYNHVRSKDEILDAVTELIDQSIDHSALDDPDWRRGLIGFAWSYRAAFQAHPEALAVIAWRPVETHAALSAYDKAMTVWQKAGWSAGDAMLIMGALEYLVLGSVLVPFKGGFVRPAAAYAQAYPGLAASLEATTGDTVDEDAFALSLDLLVAGLEDRMASAAGATERS